MAYKLNEAVVENKIRHRPATSSMSDFWSSFGVLSLIRIIAALLQPIADCDETFNYWYAIQGAKK